MVIVVAVSLWFDILLLAAAGVLTGLLFLGLVRSQAGTDVDEREQTMLDKAASATYGIFAATIGISAVLLLLFSRRGYLLLGGSRASLCLPDAVPDCLVRHLLPVFYSEVWGRRG